MKTQALTTIFITAFLGISILAIGCGPDSRDGEHYSAQSSSQAIILNNPQQHMGGYGRTQCLVCHNAALDLHRDANSPINVDDLNKAIRDNGESKYCLTCHGRNGT